MKFGFLENAMHKMDVFHKLNGIHSSRYDSPETLGYLALLFAFNGGRMKERSMSQHPILTQLLRTTSILVDFIARYT